MTKTLGQLYREVADAESVAKDVWNAIESDDDDEAWNAYEDSRTGVLKAWLAYQKKLEETENE